MKRKIFTALLSLAAFVGSAYVIPTLRLSPVEGSTITVVPDEMFCFTICYSNTNELFVYANDEYGNEMIPISEDNRNIEEERSVMYFDVINGYGIAKRYRVSAYSEDGNFVAKFITYRTISEP